MAKDSPLTPRMSFALKPEIIELLASSKRKVTTQEYRTFFRRVKKYRGNPEKEWANLIAGRPVQEVYARAFAEFLQERLQFDSGLQALFRAVFAPTDKGVWATRDILTNSVAKRFQTTDEMYTANAARDAVKAAEMIALSLGYKLAVPGDDLSKKACLKRAAKAMGRSAEEYAEWILQFAFGEFSRTLMYITHKGKRIGACVAIPLGAKATQEMLAGERHTFEFSPEDMSLPATAVFLNAMSDSDGISGIRTHTKSLAQARTLCYQLAYFSWRLKPYHPAIITFATNDFLRELLLSQGLRDTGVAMKGTNYPVMVFRHPREDGVRSAKSRSDYHFFTALLKAYNLFNARKWRMELKLLGKLP